MSRLSAIEKAIVSEFRKHWRKILRKIESGDPLANDFASAFEAPYVEDQYALSKKYYSASHANKMATLPQSQILNNFAIIHDLIEQQVRCNQLDDDPKDLANLLFKDEYIMLIPPSYISFDSGVPGAFDYSLLEEESEELDWSDWEARNYPAFGIDDWAENTVGGEKDFACILMKSTGEDFSFKEQVWLEASIIANINGNEGMHELWGLNVILLGTRFDKKNNRFHAKEYRHNKILIYFDLVEKNDYIDKIMAELKHLTKTQLSALIKTIQKNSDKCPRLYKLISKNINKKDQNKLLPQIRLILNTIENYEIKYFEIIVHHIIGDEVSNFYYHYAQSVDVIKARRSFAENYA